MTFLRNLSLSTLLLISIFTAHAQEKNLGQVSGNFQVIAQYYQPDSLIGAQAVEEKMLMNGFANINYSLGKFSAGIRYEAYLNPLLGFLPGFEGQGIPYRYAQYTEDQFDVTIGSFYEQFGSGMTLRTYEERNLGYDNALDGFRVKINPYKGIYLKGVYGKQRIYLTNGPGIVRGADVEVSLNELLDSAMMNMKTKFILGASIVSKYQDPTDVTYVLPANVGCWGYRLNIIRKGINVSGEYVYKINDPSNDNGYIYKPGQGLLLNASYSTKGFGFSAAAKYIDNMSYRSDRSEGLTNLLINYNPALTKPHTYNLVATLYPYATQLNGEVAFQAEASYKFKKNTLLGGKYGSNLTFNFATANSLDTTRLDVNTDTSRMGYVASFFAPGPNKYFTDFNVEYKMKINDKLKFILMYVYLEYNMAVVQGLPGRENVYSHVGVLDFNYKINKKHNLRFEAQHLYTEQDQGSWATALVEYTISPSWFFAALDQYNYGNSIDEKKLHYPYFNIGYINGSNRITLGYGKQRAGLFCVGGVCRVVPASSGFNISITSSF